MLREYVHNYHNGMSVFWTRHVPFKHFLICSQKLLRVERQEWFRSASRQGWVEEVQDSVIIAAQVFPPVLLTVSLTVCASFLSVTGCPVGRPVTHSCPNGMHTNTHARTQRGSWARASKCCSDKKKKKRVGKTKRDQTEWLVQKLQLRYWSLDFENAQYGHANIKRRRLALNFSKQQNRRHTHMTHQNHGHGH